MQAGITCTQENLESVETNEPKYARCAEDSGFL